MQQADSFFLFITLLLAYYVLIKMSAEQQENKVNAKENLDRTKVVSLSILI